MDFKSRNPHLTYWQESMIQPLLHPFPYNNPTDITLFEIDAPDHSTQFLGLPFHTDEKEELFVTYLLEAPRDCPMRQEFESGELTWHQFWNHRGWLIEYQYEFHINGGARIRYIDPSQMVECKKQYLTTFNYKSPLSLKLRNLELAASIKWPDPLKLEKYIDLLADFREKYPEISAKSSTDPKAA